MNTDTVTATVTFPKPEAEKIEINIEEHGGKQVVMIYAGGDNGQYFEIPEGKDPVVFHEEICTKVYAAIDGIEGCKNTIDG